MNTLSIRLFLSVIFFSISYNFVYAEPQTEMPIEPSSLANEREAKTEWEIDLHTQKSSGSTYFYLAPRTSLHESNSLLGIFIPFQFGQSKRNHLWFNTGTLYYSGGAGYRHVLENTYRNQNWFWGGYITRAYHGKYRLNNQKRDLRSINVGVELGASRLGQLTINGYIFSNEGLDKPFKQIEVQSSWAELLDGVAMYSSLIDNGGVSFKYVSTPKIWDMQFSAIGALTNVYSKVEQGAKQFSPEWVYRFGAGFEFNLSSWAHIECRWTLIDKYESLNLLPSLGIKFIGVKPHLAKDTFQGRLKRPSEYYAPVYAFSEVPQNIKPAKNSTGSKQSKEEGLDHLWEQFKDVGKKKEIIPEEIPLPEVSKNEDSLEADIDVPEPITPTKVAKDSKISSFADVLKNSPSNSPEAESAA